jgi:hypothetical protein
MDSEIILVPPPYSETQEIVPMNGNRDKSNVGATTEKTQHLNRLLTKVVETGMFLFLIELV